MNALLGLDVWKRKVFMTEWSMKVYGGVILSAFFLIWAQSDEIKTLGAYK